MFQTMSTNVKKRTDHVTKNKLYITLSQAVNNRPHKRK